MNRALWVIQGLLALLFLLRGGEKLLMSAEVLAARTPLPDLLYRFIGLAEVFGAIGLILPGLLHIRPILTPLAAVGLSFITLSATVLTLAGGQGLVGALTPFNVALLSGFVAYGRFQLVPLRDRGA